MSDNVKLVATMKDEIESNSAWCVAFELAWKELQTSILNDNFIYHGDEEIVKNLILECAKEIVIESKDFYVKSGKQTLKLKKEIEKSIKKKFKTKSDILDTINFDNDENTINILVYAILMFVIKFKNKFEIFPEKMPFGESQNLVSYFGVKKYNKKLYEQIYPLFYDSSDDFALNFESMEGKNIILYRTDSKENFETILETIRNKTDSNEKIIKPAIVAVPNLRLDLIHTFNELSDQEIEKLDDGETYKISKALQTLKFELDNEGAKVKSEAVIMIEKTSAYRPQQNICLKNFIFDKTFYLFIMEKDSPLVALRVEDINLFVK